VRKRRPPKWASTNAPSPPPSRPRLPTCFLKSPTLGDNCPDQHTTSVIAEPTSTTPTPASLSLPPSPAQNSEAVARFSDRPTNLLQEKEAPLNTTELTPPRHHPQL
ncbi:hypothetical protein KC19_7G160300, partial [Ceratodon purpureus]